jgi:hypothetical protein
MDGVGRLPLLDRLGEVALEIGHPSQPLDHVAGAGLARCLFEGQTRRRRVSPPQRCAALGDEFLDRCDHGPIMAALGGLSGQEPREKAGVPPVITVLPANAGPIAL